MDQDKAMPQWKNKERENKVIDWREILEKTENVVRK